MIELQRNTDSEKKPNGGFGPFLVEEYGKNTTQKNKLKGRSLSFQSHDKAAGMRSHLRQIELFLAIFYLHFLQNKKFMFDVPTVY